MSSSHKAPTAATSDASATSLEFSHPDRQSATETEAAAAQPSTTPFLI